MRPRGLVWAPLANGHVSTLIGRTREFLLLVQGPVAVSGYKVPHWPGCTAPQPGGLPPPPAEAMRGGNEQG